MITVADALSLSTGALYAVPLGLSIHHGSWKPLLGLVGLLGTLGIGEGMKHYVFDSPRPRGARDCNAWCNNGPCEGQPGMPSTHTAFATFFAIFYGPQMKFGEWTWLAQFLLVAYVILVAASRLIKRCHTVTQILAGAALGILIGLFVGAVAKRV